MMPVLSFLKNSPFDLVRGRFSKIWDGGLIRLEQFDRDSIRIPT